MSDIKKKIGNFSFVDTAAGQYAINMNWSQSMSQFFDAGTQDWDCLLYTSDAADD